jgi:hypothetical protein
MPPMNTDKDRLSVADKQQILICDGLIRTELGRLIHDELAIEMVANAQATIMIDWIARFCLTFKAK